MDTTLIGTIIETLTMLGAIAIFVYKLGRAVERFEVIGRMQATEIKELKINVGKVQDVVTQLALQDQRLESFEGRVNRTEKLIDELRRGEGYIIARG